MCFLVWRDSANLNAQKWYSVAKKKYIYIRDGNEYRNWYSNIRMNYSNIFEYSYTNAWFFGYLNTNCPKHHIVLSSYRHLIPFVSVDGCWPLRWFNKFEVVPLYTSCCWQRLHVAVLLSLERVKNFHARDGVDGGILLFIVEQMLIFRTIY